MSSLNLSLSLNSSLRVVVGSNQTPTQNTLSLSQILSLPLSFSLPSRTGRDRPAGGGQEPRSQAARGTVLQASGAAARASDGAAHASDDRQRGEGYHLGFVPLLALLNFEIFLN